MRSVRWRLLLMALLPLVVLLPLLFGVTMVRWINRYDDLLIAKVASDLRVAEQYFGRIEATQAAEVAALAQSVGFDRPILHGLATYGFAARALLALYCDYDPARLKALDVRFSAPVFPGEHLRIDCWEAGDTIAYRAVAVERDKVVLGKGRAVLS